MADLIERLEFRRQDYATGEEHKLAWHIWRAQNRDLRITGREAAVYRNTGVALAWDEEEA